MEEVQDKEVLQKEPTGEEPAEKPIDDGGKQALSEEEQDKLPFHQHPRWKSVYGKMKDLERKAEEQAPLVEGLREQNKILADELKRLKEGQQASEVKSFETQVKELRASRKQALLDGDADRYDELDEKLTNMLLNKPVPKETSNLDFSKVDRASLMAEAQRAQTEFIAANPEYETDEVVRSIAIGVSHELGSDPNNQKLRPKEFWEKIKDTTEARLKKMRYTPARENAVEGAGGGIKRPIGITVDSLNEKQRRAARFMFNNLTPEKAYEVYVEQLKLVEAE